MSLVVQDNWTASQVLNLCRRLQGKEEAPFEVAFLYGRHNGGTHVDMLYVRCIPKHLAMFCIAADRDAAPTIVYDGGIAAKMLQERYPELAELEICWKSSFRQGLHARHKLIERGQLIWAPTSLIREIPETIERVTVEEVERAILSVLEDCPHEVVHWKPGRAVFSLNTIHTKGEGNPNALRLHLRIRF